MNSLFSKLFLLALFVSISSFAQISKDEKSGNTYFKAFNHRKAIESYESADSLSADGKRNLANSYRFVNDNEKALKIYEQLAKSENANTGDLFLYAQTLKMLSLYEESNVWMKKYYEKNNTDSRAIEHIAFPNYATDLKSDEARYKIITLNINSEQEDFSPSFYKNQIIFASSRESLKAVDRKWNGTMLPFIDMYMADTTEGNQLSNPQLFPTEFNEKYHDGPAGFSNNGKLMVFTRNNYKAESVNGTKKLKMFYSVFNGKKWKSQNAVVQRLA